MNKDESELIFASGVGSAAAFVALSKTSLSPSQLYRRMTPTIRTGVSNNELLGPKVMLSRENEAYKAYEEMWNIQSMSGVRIWLQICQNMIGQGGIPALSMKDWSLFFSYIRKVFPFISIAELGIPHIYEEGNTTKFRMMTLTDYIHHQGSRFTPYLFFSSIVEMVLFGFPTDLSVLKALRFTGEEITAYMKSRLQGGEFFPF